VAPLNGRFTKRDATGSQGAKRTSAPPGFAGAGSRTSGERLKPLSEAKLDQCSLESNKPRLVSAAGSKEKTEIAKPIVSGSTSQSNAEPSSVFLDEMEEWGKVNANLFSFVCSTQFVYSVWEKYFEVPNFIGYFVPA
jgi:hypothetical protein